MDKLHILEEGKVDIRLDDIDYLQNVIRDTFEKVSQVVSLAGSDTGIFRGCFYTLSGGLGSNIYSVEAGLMILNGELFSMAAHTSTVFAGASQGLYWVIKETSDPAGTDVKGNAATIEKYKVRAVELLYFDPSGSSFTVGTDCFAVADVPRYSSGLQAAGTDGGAVSYTDQEWSVLTFLNGHVSVYGVFVRKGVDGFVRIWGDLNSASATNAEAFVLPVGFRPKSTLRVYGGSGTGFISPTGSVTFTGTDVKPLSINFYAG